MYKRNKVLKRDQLTGSSWCQLERILLRLLTAKRTTFTEKRTGPGGDAEYSAATEPLGIQDGPSQQVSAPVLLLEDLPKAQHVVPVPLWLHGSLPAFHPSQGEEFKDILTKLLDLKEPTWIQWQPFLVKHFFLPCQMIGEFALDRLEVH